MMAEYERAKILELIKVKYFSFRGQLLFLFF